MVQRITCSSQCVTCRHKCLTCSARCMTCTHECMTCSSKGRTSRLQPARSRFEGWTSGRQGQTSGLEFATRLRRADRCDVQRRTSRVGCQTTSCRGLPCRSKGRTWSFVEQTRRSRGGTASPGTESCRIRERQWSAKRRTPRYRRTLETTPRHGEPDFLHGARLYALVPVVDQP